MNEICREGEFGYTEDNIDVCKLVTNFLQEVLKYGPKLVILFGSRVENRWKPWSDIDVMIIFDKIDNKLDLIIELGKKFPDFELRIYTIEEFIKGIEYCDIGILDAIDHGRILHNDGVFEKIKSVFEYYKEFYGLERIEDGWIARKWWNLPWNRKS